MSLQEKDFHFLRDLVRERSGISLSESKEYLLESRLLPIIRQLNMRTIADLARHLRSHSDAELTNQIVEAMTTNESSFFRDIKPFDHIKEYVLPHFQLYNPDATSMRIWSAACSSGQEPYSLAMTFLDPVVTKMGITAEIIATDIDSTMLEKAQNGLYTQFEVQRGLPVQMLLRYFKQLESYGDKWQISDTLRKMVTFRQKNLIDDFLDMGRFDLIFCRNVLIYFEDGTKQEVLKKLARCLTPHGLLILGSTESLSHLDTPLTPFKNLNGIFCLKGT